MNDLNEVVEYCAQFAEDMAQACSDGEGEIYIARKIADKIRKNGILWMVREAQKVLASAKIDVGQAFDALTNEQRDIITAEAAAAYLRKHGRPMPADNATFVRKRYDLLQQRARS